MFADEGEMAGGEQGVRLLFQHLREELVTSITLLGANALSDLSQDSDQPIKIEAARRPPL